MQQARSGNLAQALFPSASLVRNVVLVLGFVPSSPWPHGTASSHPGCPCASLGVDSSAALVGLQDRPTMPAKETVSACRR